MTFFNGKKRSKLFVVALLIVLMIAGFSMPVSVYAAGDNPRASTESALVAEPYLQNADGSYGQLANTTEEAPSVWLEHLSMTMITAGNLTGGYMPRVK
jgi:hypothetical protein